MSEMSPPVDSEVVIFHHSIAASDEIICFTKMKVTEIYCMLYRNETL
jgi:hypothetical protein